MTFNLFSSHATPKLITKILWHTGKRILFLADGTKNLGIIWIHSYQTAIVVLNTVFFFFF